MSTPSNETHGLLGLLKPRGALGLEHAVLDLPQPTQQGGMPLMEVFKNRHSAREFKPDDLSPQQLSDLLWAAYGINRPDIDGRTVPSAMHANEIDLYLALSAGLYKYDPGEHVLRFMSSKDIRAVSGYQDFVDSAPLDLIFVVDHARMKSIPEAQRNVYAAVCIGAISQNIYLYCASFGLATVVRGWFDQSALSDEMPLGSEEYVLLTQTVGLAQTEAQMFQRPVSQPAIVQH